MAVDAPPLVLLSGAEVVDDCSAFELVVVGGASLVVTAMVVLEEPVSSPSHITWHTTTAKTRATNTNFMFINLIF